jgi:hypothetical protein
VAREHAQEESRAARQERPARDHEPARQGRPGVVDHAAKSGRLIEARGGYRTAYRTVEETDMMGILIAAMVAGGIVVALTRLRRATRSGRLSGSRDDVFSSFSDPVGMDHGHSRRTAIGMRPGFRRMQSDGGGGD